MNAAEPSLAGRVALVTGASRGIGRAIARRLAAHGAAVVVTSSPRSASGLAATRSAIEAAGGRAATLVADLADAADRQRLVDAAQQAFGLIELLVNNAAGISAYALPSRIDAPARRAMFELNFEAPVDLVQKLLPGMRTRGYGRIVNIGSEMAQQPPIPYPGPAKFVHALTLYGCTKAALERYTQGLAAELHGSGIGINLVSPHKIARSESAEAVAQHAQETHPDWIEPVEMMAEAVYRLTTSSLTGWSGSSRALLQLLQAPLLGLDGVSVLGDALTLDRELGR
jgi:NAD(P)-dependent dehydrogenase (short-subunit alcohol dehydrogenase family)